MTQPITARDFLDDLLADHGPTPAPQDTAETRIELTIARFVLAALLEKAATVIPTRDVMPVLKNFHIEAGPDRLRVVATDLELSMICTSPLVAVTHPGTAVLPARKMLDILREANESDVTLHIRGTTAAITIGRTTWSLKLAGGADYPPMPTIDDATFAPVHRGRLITALQAVRYAACKDPTRANLMMIDVKNGRMTACDGARFQQATTETLPFDCQIPIGAVDHLLKLLRTIDTEEISIGQATHQLLFALGADVLIVNKLMATFPDMEALLLRPALENTHPLTVGRGDLLAAVKRTRIAADPQTSAVALTLDRRHLTVAAKDKYGNTARETIDATWPGATRTLYVNHGYLTDMIGTYTDATLHFWLGEDTRTRRCPLLLRHPDAEAAGVLNQMVGDWVAD